MAKKVDVVADGFERPSEYARKVLVEHILWLIRLRWVAVVGILAVAVGGSYVFPVLISPVPIYICAALLFVTNVIYSLAATKEAPDTSAKDTVLGMAQTEIDLFILTAVLHFSGGVTNPFFLFYVFHVIIATIMLPRNHSFIVGLTAIFLFGLLAVNELNGGGWLGYYPLQLSIGEGLWRNPVYALGAFVSFVCTIMLVQYLTRIIIVRMTAKEAEASRSHDVLKAVINAMSEGLIFVMHDGKVAVCNPAAKLWRKSDDTNESIFSFDDFPPPLSKLFKQLFDSNQKVYPAGVIEFDTDGPERSHIEAKCCSVAGIDGQHLGYVIVGQDLTAHKKLERELREQTEEVSTINEMLKLSRINMSQREKMVAIGQMATGIAHEIGNPLASLSSVVQYLGRKLGTHEEKEQLLMIEYQVNRISNILKRMLSMSHPATAKYKWTDINELIDNTLSLLKFDKRMKSITLESIASPELPSVWLNPHLFEQVLLNILINALDAMNAKPTEGKHVLQIKREFKEKKVEVRIRDTGIGMSPQVAKRAFESFFTTKEISKGTGLGLFISYNLVREIDGTIELESEEGKGTTVIIRIPIRSEKGLMVGDKLEEDLLNKAQTPR
ncbi:MAG: two-component system sensor histidine kinase NtrB [Planctomycetota bacterium]|jgi:signal transduction histidine kinase